MATEDVRRRARAEFRVNDQDEGGAEFRRYFDILRRRWLIMVVAFVATAGATLFLVLPQPNVYEASGTFVVVPRTADAEESLEAFDTLIRGDAINSTYATIARSNMVRARAESRVDPSIDTSDATVSADVQTGTNILSITVQSLSPEVAQKLALAVGEETINYVGALNEAYRLQPLDIPTEPESPVGPKKLLTSGVGMILGLLLGVGLAVASDFVLAQLARAADDDDDDHREALDADDEEDADALSLLRPAGSEPGAVAGGSYSKRRRRPVDRTDRKPPPPPPTGASSIFPVGLERSVWSP